MPWTDSSGPVPRRSPEDLRDAVGSRVGAIRERRRRRATVLSSLVVLVAGISAAVIRSDDSRSTTEVRSASGGLTASGESTSSSPAPPTSVATGLGPSTTPSSPPSVPLPTLPPTTTSRLPTTTTTAQVPTTTVVGGTTTTSLSCRNSGDPACGPLVWDPPPGVNRPLIVKVTFTPAAPRVGETVTFRVEGDDPDSPSSSCGDENFGDGDLGRTCVNGACPGQWGPWTPVVTPGHQEVTYSHAYTAAGTYTATFMMSSSGCGASKPYGSEGSSEARVVVSP